MKGMPNEIEQEETQRHDEIGALRERAEAAERKAGDLQHLADGAMRFKLRQFVRIRKLEAALRRCKDCAIDNCGDITAAEFEEKYRDKGADVEEIIPAIVDEALARQSEAGQSETREGKVVITTNEQDDCVAITRQDDEGRILSVIWERPSPPPQGNAEDMRYEAAGWMHAECCAALDRGDDPRTMDVAAMKERMDRALAAHKKPNND